MNTAEKLTLPGPGIYSDIPFEDYLAMDDYVSKSYLTRLDKCPAAARVPRKDTAALSFGRPAHSYLLEGPEKFFQNYIVMPANAPKRPSVTQINAKNPSAETEKNILWWDEFEKANEGKVLVAGDDFLKLVEMKKALNAHPFASKLLADGVAEQTVIWKDPETGIMCKCRPDHEPGKRILADLKSCANAGEFDFRRDVVKYGYDMQAGMYLDGTTIATGEEYDGFVFVAIEKEEPFRVETYLLDAEFIVRGQYEYRRLLNIELECRRTGFYPNYQGIGNLITLEKPQYL